MTVALRVLAPTPAAAQAALVGDGATPSPRFAPHPRAPDPRRCARLAALAQAAGAIGRLRPAQDLAIDLEAT
ncbi:hypothetical protein SAMN05216258_11141 [Albimonas pacifica]|uniref:Uncharacterized protein n=1 Tax=Albimonas pacifica TaxID=1114924 RepID=A0A1I3MCF7_9RHOB|nr:hypothetical protein SAMN05216258_11141 [Albimonas pacifica]